MLPISLQIRFVDSTISWQIKLPRFPFRVSFAFVTPAITRQMQLQWFPFRVKVADILSDRLCHYWKRCRSVDDLSRKIQQNTIHDLSAYIALQCLWSGVEYLASTCYVFCIGRHCINLSMICTGRVIRIIWMLCIGIPCITMSMIKIRILGINTLCVLH